MTDAVQASINSTFQPVHNAMVPKEGPKAIPLKLDFTSAQAILVDLTQQQQSARISFLQGAFVDNSANLAPVTISTGNSQQDLTIPPQSQAYIPLLLPNPPTFIVSTTGGVFVPIIVLNIPMDIAIWSVNGEAEVINGMLQVQDAALEALISGGALTTADKNLAPLITDKGNGEGLDVNVISGGGSSAGFSFIGKSLTENFAGGNVDLIAASAGNYTVINYLKVWLAPNTFLAGSARTLINIYDVTNDISIAEFSFFPPGSAPSAPAYPILLWEMEGMNISLPVVNDILRMSSSNVLSNDGLIISFGYNYEVTP